MLNSWPPEQYRSRADLLVDCELLEKSGLLDSQAYRVAAGIAADISAAEHYLASGWRIGLEPGPQLDGNFLYPYFRCAGLNAAPAITYLTLREAGWPVYATKAQAEAVAAIFRDTRFFDANSYVARVDCNGLDPALHYVIVGEQLGHQPSGEFDPAYYSERYPDVSSSGVNRLAHYLLNGRQEGRRPVSVITGLAFDTSRLNPARETVLVLSHQASRTGAPILALNIASRLQRDYNVVALLLSGGELVSTFEATCAAVVGPLSYDDWHAADAERLVKRLLEFYPLSYAIANSIETRFFVPALATALVPVVTLVHEFASYTRPKGTMGECLDWSTQVVFSSELTASSAKSEHPALSSRTIHILPQGRCEVPPGDRRATEREARELRRLMRPSGAENALVVLGCGTLFIRKGVDVFLACAAAVEALNPDRSVRFVWIGNPEQDPAYSLYLAEQIARSGLEGKIAITAEVSDLGPAYDSSDVFFLSSRLDPLPNVAIDAAFQGLPVVCFENASGIAALLRNDPSLSQCVVPYLDASTAARVIAELADDEGKRMQIGEATRRFAKATFRMGDYVRRLDQLGREAIEAMNVRRRDFVTLRDDDMFDELTFLPFGSPTFRREDAIKHFLARWSAVGTSRRPAENFYFRRPCPGFHPQIYAHEQSHRYDAAKINPLAHFIRSNKPAGPWRHEVITPSDIQPQTGCTSRLRAALHVHFYYPELATAFLNKLSANGSPCDLFISTDSENKAAILRRVTADYERGQVLIRVFPNRGRDIGPLLTAFAQEIMQKYDLIGHLHGKRSLFAADALMGETWREFLWQNLLGDLYPMMDLILARFAADEGLGIVFPDDPHLPDWDRNLEIATDLATRMGMKEPLPPFFDFPVGTMFWARTQALKPLLDLPLGWHDYPEEPLPIDGTILHAIERLLPFVARHAGYRFLTTHIPGVTW